MSAFNGEEAESDKAMLSANILISLLKETFLTAKIVSKMVIIRKTLAG